jgi:hyperosmotically inducible protein
VIRAGFSAFAQAIHTARVRQRTDASASEHDNRTRLKVCGNTMKINFSIACVLLGTLLGSAVTLADEDAAMTGSHALAYVKDSAITTQVKARLAAEQLTSLARIHVDTDTNGVVWLSGSAKTQESIDEAIAITRHTDGVKAVHNDIKINNDE